MKAPGAVFYIEAPAGAYGSPHAAPRFNERTGETHPHGCRCEKCCPGSLCACYACSLERVLSAA